MVSFKFKTRYGYTSVIAELIGKRIRFKLSPLKGFRPFPIECFAEYNRELLYKKKIASVVIVCDSNKLSMLEIVRLKEKAKELLPVPIQAIDLVFERLAKGDYSVVR